MSGISAPNARHHPPARKVELESRAVAGRVHAVVRRHPRGIKRPYVSQLSLHQDVRLWVRAQLKHVLADRAKVPLAVEGLRPPVPLPHAEPYSPVPSLSRLVDARAHQRLSDATSEPFARRIPPDQFDGVCAFA